MAGVLLRTGTGKAQKSIDSLVIRLPNRNTLNIYNIYIANITETQLSWSYLRSIE